MRKKIALSAIIILILACVGYGTYAYMTAERTVQNVITAGNVKIKLNEAENALNVMPATSATHEVTVTNTGDNDCYVRVKITADIKSSSGSTLSAAGITFNMDTDGWVQDSEGYWRYRTKLSKGDTTSNLLKTILFDVSMGNEYQSAVLNLSVSAQAVQSANNSFDATTGSVLDIVGWPSSSTASE